MLISLTTIYYMLFVSLPPIIHIDTFKTQDDCEKVRQEWKVKSPRYTQYECVQIKIKQGELNDKRK